MMMGSSPESISPKRNPKMMMGSSPTINFTKEKPKNDDEEQMQE